MTPEHKAEIVRLCEMATPGPWDCDDADEPRGGYNLHAGWFSVSQARTEDMVFTNQPEMGMLDRHADARFVCAARTAVPELLTDNAALEAQLQEARAEVEQLRESLIHACELQRASHDNAQQLWAMRQTANSTSKPFSHDRVEAAYGEYADLLAAALKAKDEACDKLETWIPVLPAHLQSAGRADCAELRAVGKERP